MRFLTSKHHLCTPVPLRSAITAWQITLQLRPPPRQSTRWMQPSQCSPEFNFTRENAFERKRVKAGPVAQTRFPTTTPGATLREKTQGFVRFLTSKHHLCTPVPLRSAITAWQITLQLRPPPRQSTRWMQPSQCSPEFNFTRENAFERKRVKAGPVAQTRFPTTTPGATLREKTQGFVRFLTSKHHLYSRSAAICHHCLANHTTTASASRPPLSSHPYIFPHPYSLHL